MACLGDLSHSLGYLLVHYRFKDSKMSNSCLGTVSNIIFDILETRSTFDQIWDLGPLTDCRNILKCKKVQIPLKHDIFVNLRISNLEQYGIVCTNIFKCQDFMLCVRNLFFETLKL